MGLAARPTSSLPGALIERRWTARLVVLVAMASLGCAGRQPASLSGLRYRATFDLTCPASELQLFHIDARTKAVAGCGRALVYVEQCAGGSDESVCSWLANTPPAATTPPPPSIAPTPTGPTVPGGANSLLLDRY